MWHQYTVDKRTGETKGCVYRMPSTIIIRFRFRFGGRNLLKVGLSEDIGCCFNSHVIGSLLFFLLHISIRTTGGIVNTQNTWMEMMKTWELAWDVNIIWHTWHIFSAIKYQEKTQNKIHKTSPHKKIQKLHYKNTKITPTTATTPLQKNTTLNEVKWWWREVRWLFYIGWLFL